ncbi:ATP-grasp domain-containing protein [Pseudoalteromonas sp. R3]|uniref:ATP-grasp domain-containing protein n=1 Tax=Pseudoalteromonas sp. R3 TaxID=1709477 RepID=UPI0006B4825A|nr:ATP-grasp domain-containing protein [Pseudoalteromonas sp. R3]AZZ97415.1 ATP-grasp domain-containing protein [Pseudoalteromonas sp. R3]
MIKNRIALIGHKSAGLTFIFEAAERLGYEIYQVVCQGETCFTDSPVCKDIIELDLFGAPQSSYEQFATFFSQHNLNGIFTMREQLIPWVEQACVKSSLKHNGLECAIACRDKLIMRTRLTEAGIPQPFFVDGRHIEDMTQIRFPVVVKPSAGAGSIGVIKANNEQELKAAIELTQTSNSRSLDKESLYVDKGGIIVEEYVQGEELVCDTFSVDGKLEFISIGNKGDCQGPYFEKSIYQVPAQLDATLKARIVTTVERALTAVGLRNGPSHTELRVCNGIPYIIEVGARVGGSGVPAELIRLSSGIELFEACFKLATGCALDPATFQSKKSKYAGNYVIPLGTGGFFTGYQGLEWVNSVAQTQRVVTNYKQGDYVPGYPLCTSYPGFIISEHHTFQDMHHFHQQVKDNLYIEWQEGEQ